MPNLLEQAQEFFPALKDLDMQYKESPQLGRGFLEFWPGDEPGTADSPRPSEFKRGVPGIEVYDPKTRPIDVAGDIVSHHLVKTDPTIKAYYEQFEQSLTPQQRQRLIEQYRHARANEGETRPFEQWYEHSGLPGYFRGYAFQQWDRPETMYTAEQLTRFNEMLAHLKRVKK